MDDEKVSLNAVLEEIDDAPQYCPDLNKLKEKIKHLNDITLPFTKDELEDLRLAVLLFIQENPNRIEYGDGRYGVLYHGHESYDELLHKISKAIEED